MSHSRNNNLIDDPENELDPDGNGLITVEPEPVRKNIFERSKNIGFNSNTFTLYGSQPIRIVGHDPARQKLLINMSANVDVLLGDQATTYAGQGFNITNHNSGGAIEINTTEEIWAVLKDPVLTNTVTVYVWIERSVGY